MCWFAAAGFVSVRSLLEEEVKVLHNADHTPLIASTAAADCAHPVHPIVVFLICISLSLFLGVLLFGCTFRRSQVSAAVAAVVVAAALHAG